MNIDICVWLELSSFIPGWKRSYGRAGTPRAVRSAREFCVSWFPPARVDGLLSAQLTLPRGQANPIRGARSNLLIPFNTSVTVCFRDRSYLCRILTLRYTHPCASQDWEGQRLAMRWTGLSWKQGLGPSDGTHNWPSLGRSLYQKWVWKLYLKQPSSDFIHSNR